MSNVGINLAAVNYWGSQFPFIDRMKSAGWWTAVDTAKNSTTLETIDANGYPTSLPANTSYIYTSVALDPVELAMTDRYVITYTGAATIVPVGMKIISSEPGRIVFEAVKDRVQLKVSGLDGADPLADLSIVREDQVGLFDKGEIFNPDFVSKIDPFSTLRFMDWIGTNESKITSWDERPTLDDRSWAGSEGGVPIEVMVALSNKTQNNMWINIPAEASDDYVRRTLEYVRDHLDPGLTVKVEYSNEMWNFGFEQTKWALKQGDALFGVDANGDGTIDANDPKEHVGDGYLQYYGYRAAQVAAIGNEVFGSQADARLENVLATNTTFNTASIVTGIAKAGLGPVAALFDNYAVAAYFGGFGSGTKDDIATLLDWARKGSAGVDAAISEIINGGALSQTLTVASVSAKLLKHGDLASALGLNFVTYEGGAAMTANRAATADQAVLMEFYNRVMADPRMGDIYREIVTAFAAAGGTEFNAFNDSGSATNKYGQWGALATIYEEGSVRYNELVQLAIEGATGGKTGTETKTAQSVYVMSPTQTDMTYIGSSHATITGNDLVNRLTAGDGGSALYGYAGDDRLVGGSGADYLDGGSGADILTGGAGDDIYIVDNVGDKVVELAGGGTDEVRTSLTRYLLGANLENLTYTGSDAFTGTGNALDNVIRGGAGDDVLNGGLGNDVLYGGDGNDTFGDTGGADLMIGGRGDDIYNVDNVGDRIIEAPGEGFDQVYTTVSFSLAGQALEGLRAKGNAAIDLTGNELDNALIGNDAVNVIRGGDGIDSIKGMGGNDRLFGDDGNDVIDGGAGNDYIEGGNGNDRLVGGDGDDVIIGGAGADLITGGAGKDIFRYLSIEDLGTTRTNTDIIYDFASGDKIDLRAIDANIGTARDDAFTFIGTSAFSGTAGELRATLYAGRWEIAGDVNGDGVGDFLLLANKTGAFVNADFVL